MRTRQSMTMTAAGVLLASLALAGCGQREEAAQKQPSDSTAQVPRDAGDASRQAANQAKDSAQQAANDMKEATRQAANDMKDATRSAADQATNKVSDALITTSVNAELAKDPKLSSVRIDVDTDSGRVALRGSAPDQAAKERATQLASAVKGVVSVDNQLTVETKG